MESKVDKGTEVEQFWCEECNQPYCTCCESMMFCVVCEKTMCSGCWEGTYEVKGYDETMSPTVCGECWEEAEENERINKEDEAKEEDKR